MTAEERALLNAILAAPDDDLPRLVYADWLDENGRPERAEFIRLQCAWAKALHDPDRGDRVYLADRLQDLVWAHGEDCWELPPAQQAVVRWGEAERGFVNEAIVFAWEVEGTLDELFAVVPITRLTDFYTEGHDFEAFLGDPILNRLRHLGVIPDAYHAVEWYVRDVRQLIAHRWPRSLTGIELRQFPPAAVALLAEAPTGVDYPTLDLRAIEGLDDGDRRRLRARFGDRVLL
jgi:uncharacterized protein (TIGR02996 family)